MKTKLNYLALSIMALLMSLNGCSNGDSTENVDKQPKSVFLKLGKTGPSSRSVGTPVGDGDNVILQSGDLYFVNVSGSILEHYTLTSDPTNTTNISLQDAEDGALITNLPGNTYSVYVVGNTPNLPSSGNISAVKENLLQVASQDDIEEVNLYGSNLLVAPVLPNTFYTCVIDLNPTVARIQLTDITSSGAIINFKVDGVFIDNYYKQAVVSGSVNVDNFIQNGAVAPPFNNETTQYPAGLKSAIYDFHDPALAAVSKVAKPTPTGSIWTYNLFASSVGSTVPRIIIRLSDIQTNDSSTYPSPQFVTIKGFKAVSGGASLTSIKSGEIYNIAAGALTFKETDLSPIPNLSPIDVEVTVNLASWSVVGVTPEL